jgi:hypothetical protein
MRKVLPVVAAVLALAYLAPLSMLPSANNGTEAFERHAWFLNLAMLCFNAVGVVLLYRLRGVQWTAFAILFCGVQVAVWWWFSGIRSMDGNFAMFLEQKVRATRALLAHSDIRVAIASFHQDIAVGLFYHFALAWLLIQIATRKTASATEA